MGVASGDGGGTETLVKRAWSGGASARALLLTLGLAILVGLGWQIGPEKILIHIRSLGWALALIPLPYLLVFFFDALGWRYAFGRTIPVGPFRLTGVQIVGKAVNTLTPLIPLGGEPIKAYLIQRVGIPLTEGLAAVVISRTLIVIAQGLFILGVSAFISARLGLGAPLLKATLVAIVTGIVLVGTFVVAQIRGLFAGMLGFMRALKLRVSFLEEGARDVDRQISDFYRHRWRRLCLVLAFHLLGWLAEGLEVYLLLTLLNLNRSPLMALGFVAFSSAVRGASFLIPGSLGIQEGGDVVILGTFGIAPEAAMALSVLRRLREWGWASAGLFLLSRYGWSQVPLASAPVGAVGGDGLCHGPS